MKVIPGNAQHIGCRQSQQDEFWFSDVNDHGFIDHGGVLAIVADGMGGLEKGAEASRLAARTFGQAYLAKDPADSIPDALANALEEANQAVCALARDVGELGNVGTTLVAAVVAGQSLHWLSVGDSRLYVFRNGELTQFTEDHNYGGMLQKQVAEGQLSADEADSDPDRNALTSFVGMPGLETVDHSIAPFSLEPGDWVLLCSDGLHGTLGEEEIARELRGTPQEAAGALVRRALEKGNPHQDNVTVALMACARGGGAGQFWQQPYAWLALLALIVLLPAGWGVKHYFFPEEQGNAISAQPPSNPIQEFAQQAGEGSASPNGNPEKPPPSKPAKKNQNPDPDPKQLGAAKGQRSHATGEKKGKMDAKPKEARPGEGPKAAPPEERKPAAEPKPEKPEEAKRKDPPAPAKGEKPRTDAKPNGAGQAPAPAAQPIE